MKAPSDDALRALLEGPEDYISDDGFTERVMQALPPRPARNEYRGRILPVSALLAGVLGFCVLPGGAFLAHAFREVFTLSGLATLPLVSMAVVACTIWTVCIIADE
jgi:hypothetical protein